jgi:hypothetical protein
MTLLAHPGHWIWQLLYLAPIVAMVGALAWAKHRDSRNADRDEDV